MISYKHVGSLIITKGDLEMDFVFLILDDTFQKVNFYLMFHGELIDFAKFFQFQFFVKILNDKLNVLYSKELFVLELSIVLVTHCTQPSLYIIRRNIQKSLKLLNCGLFL